MVGEDDLRRIEREARSRFEERLEKEGTDPTALGWDSEESMRTRFGATLDLYDFSGARVLDVGCGFGDFYGFLREHDQEPREYYGVDISDEILAVARDRFPSATFEKRNVLVSPFEDQAFDIAVEFGLLNYNLDISNEAYLRHYLETTIGFSDATLVNCLSRYREGNWEWEEFVYYYSPEKAFGYAQELSRDVVLKHDFEPIPQKEFLLLLRS